MAAGFQKLKNDIYAPLRQRIMEGEKSGMLGGTKKEPKENGNKGGNQKKNKGNKKQEVEKVEEVEEEKKEEEPV